MWIWDYICDFADRRFRELMNWLFTPLLGINQFHEKEYIEYCMFDRISSSMVLQRKLDDYFSSQWNNVPMLTDKYSTERLIN